MLESWIGKLLCNQKMLSSTLKRCKQNEPHPSQPLLTTSIVLYTPKSSSSQKVMSWTPIPGILAVPEYSAKTELSTELSLFSDEFFDLKNGRCVSLTLAAQPE
eukprot:Gb_08931 [translate_table: standard]